MTKPQLILTRGIPASGKTTWAKAWVEEDPERRIRLNRDDLRQMLHGKRHGLTYAQEQGITEIQRATARDALARGVSVVVDDTNLRARFAREWMALHPVTFQDFEISLEVALVQNMRREHPVAPDVVKSFYDRFTRRGFLPAPPEPDEQQHGATYVPDWDLDQAYIFDIDGTLAHIVPGGRSPYDGHRVGEDTVDEHVAGLLRHLEATYHVVIMSGRDETHRAITERWLLDNAIPYDELHMRPAGDTRKDHVVKAELFDQHIRHRFNVLGVFDDRNRVVAGWRGMGLTTYQVAEGNF